MKVALWLRVSTDDQTVDNQRLALTELADRKGMDVVAVYEAVASGWKGQQQKQLSQLYQSARLGKFDVVLCWALDRLSREGVSATLQIIDRLGKSGVKVLSLQEQWTEVDGPLKELLLSIVAWVARMESERRSERTKAGLTRAVKEGKRLGRPPGSKDGKHRRKSGYYARYSDKQTG